MAGGGAVELYVDPDGEEDRFWEFGGIGVEYLFGLGDGLEFSKEWSILHSCINSR